MVKKRRDPQPAPTPSLTAHEACHNRYLRAKRIRRKHQLPNHLLSISQAKPDVELPTNDVYLGYLMSSMSSKSNSVYYVYYVGYSIINKVVPGKTGGFADNFSVLRELRSDIVF